MLLRTAAAFFLIALSVALSVAFEVCLALAGG
jgi:hypothetical protein